MPDPLVLDVAPNWSHPITERLEWSTDIMKRRDGTEQRVALRKFPRQTIEYHFLVYKKHLQRFRHALQLNQGSEWIVPLWFHMAKLEASFGLSDTTLTVDVYQQGWNEATHVLFYSSQEAYEVAAIDSMTTNQVVLAAAPKQIWPQGIWIVPARLGYVREAVQLENINPEVSTGVLQVYFDAMYDSPVVADWPWLNGKVYFNAHPNWAKNRKATWDRPMGLIDYKVGPTVAYDMQGYTEVTRDYDYLMHHRSLIYNFRQALFYLQGSFKSFYISTFTRDVTIITPTVLASDQSLEIEFVFFRAAVLERLLHCYLYIKLRSGQELILHVINAADYTEAFNEVLYFDAPIGVEFDAAEVLEASFIFNSRLDADTVEINWITPSVATMLLPIRSIL